MGCVTLRVEDLWCEGQVLTCLILNPSSIDFLPDHEVLLPCHHISFHLLGTDVRFERASIFLVHPLDQCSMLVLLIETALVHSFKSFSVLLLVSMYSVVTLLDLGIILLHKVSHTFLFLSVLFVQPVVQLSISVQSEVTIFRFGHSGGSEAMSIGLLIFLLISSFHGFPLPLILFVIKSLMNRLPGWSGRS